MERVTFLPSATGGPEREASKVRLDRLVTCLLVNFGRAKIQVRRLGMTRAAATGDVELEVKDVQ